MEAYPTYPFDHGVPFFGHRMCQSPPPPNGRNRYRTFPLYILLENLYSSTLVTRVNIALQYAILSGDRRITIITCPGAFNSHDRGKRTVILGLALHLG